MVTLEGPKLPQKLSDPCCHCAVCRRSKGGITKSQQGFFDFVVIPQMKAFCKVRRLHVGLLCVQPCAPLLLQK